MVGLAVVGTVMLVIGSGRAQADSGGPATWTSVLQLVLGALFLLLAVKQWRGRPRPGQEAPAPKWMGAIDTFTAGKAFGLGVLLSAVNPKNLVLTIGAAVAIVQTGISAGEEAGAMIVFVAIGSVTILAALVIYFTMGERATDILGGLKTWMGAHNAAIMTVLFLVLGVKLVGDAIGGLSS